MRTKQLRINGETIEAVLLCGGFGGRVYSSENRLFLQVGRKTVELKDGTLKRKIALRFVNKPYAPIEDHAEIETEFIDLVQWAKGGCHE